MKLHFFKYTLSFSLRAHGVVSERFHSELFSDLFTKFNNNQHKPRLRTETKNPTLSKFLQFISSKQPRVQLVSVHFIGCTYFSRQFDHHRCEKQGHYIRKNDQVDSVLAW